MNAIKHRQRARWLVPAALLLALGLTAAIVLATSDGKGRGTAGKNAAGRPQSCPASSVSNNMPTAPPSDLAWNNVGGMLIPSSATAGPARYQGDVWSCYAHSPMGAVMAAYDIFAGLGSPDWHAVAEHEIVPGPGQQAFITISDSQTYQAPPPGAIAQAVGFEVVAYTPQQATIEALASAGTDAYQADVRTVAWVDGDWKMVVTPDGKTGPDTQLVTSAGGFVLWGSAGNG